MRSIPVRVNTATSTPTSIGRLRWARPPTPAYSPSEVLAHDHPVDLVAELGSKRPVEARQEPGRADVGELVEPLADREAQLPQSYVIGDIGIAGRTEEDCIEAVQALDPVPRHHLARAGVTIRSPVEALEVEAERVVRGRKGLQDLTPGLHDVGTDAITADQSDLMARHEHGPPCPSGCLRPYRSFRQFP